MFTDAGLELTTTAVFLLTVFAVELFVVVVIFDVLVQAEKSNAKEAMLNVDRVVLFKIFNFPFRKLILQSAYVTSKRQVSSEPSNNLPVLM